MSIVVAQLGARRHYAVPRILFQAGLLRRLYTDAYAWERLAWLIDLFPRCLSNARFRRLAERKPEGISPNAISAFHLFGLHYEHRRRNARSVSDSTKAHLWAGKRFCSLIMRAGLDGASAVYAFNSAGLELFQHARRMGLKTIVEQTIAPRRVEAALLAREHQRYPSWEELPFTDVNLEEFADREEAEWREADLVICGSSFVKDGIFSRGGPIDRCRVVPYGVDDSFLVSPRTPHTGRLRVLTVGAVGLRKGSPYVLQAAKALHRDAEFRLVGPVQVSASAQGELRQHVDLRGAVPRSEMREHFQWADAFLLPSICEGSAVACYEALTAGLPVITTPNTGSIVQDGIDGFIVSAGDQNGIEEKLELLCRDRDNLRELQRNAAQSARHAGIRAYADRLIPAISPLLQ